MPASSADDRSQPNPALAVVARQAIVDASKDVVAYELLYRQTETAAAAAASDGERATLEVIANAVLEIGLDRLSPELPVHINYPRDLLVQRVVPPVFPQRVVIEVLETVRADPEVLAGLAALKAKGYQIALDDFSPEVTDMKLLDHADIVKLDLSQHAPERFDEFATALKKRRVRLIAERVETIEAFERCVALGFDAFQGNFLQNPKTFSARPIPSNRFGALRIVSLLQKEDSEISDIERLVAHDLGLSYRILRCINSSYYGFSKKVDSIRQAVMILGFERLRQLCALVALRELGDRPPSVFVNAMTRARMCEMLGPLRNMRDTAGLFILGLFSTLDVLTGMSMRDLLKELPLSEDLVDALLTHQGLMGSVLREVIVFERGQWQAIAFRGLKPEVIQSLYLESVEWAEAAHRAVSQ
jgi:EAL and modified HD-GYP domain-containing signal transduction protein